MGLRIVQFNEKDSVKVMGLSDDYGWSYQYFGDDEFAFTDEQLEMIAAKGIPFREIGTQPPKKSRNHKKTYKAG